ILANYKDFFEQKSALEEKLLARGYKCLFLPKFHCELNLIEMYWAYYKNLYRQVWKTTFDDVSDHFLVTFLNTESFINFKFYSRHDKRLLKLLILALLIRYEGILIELHALWMLTEKGLALNKQYGVLKNKVAIELLARRG
ncbi:hypothetical protein DL98DRAFT_429424, partial [Cadophora sp. DSE1049]